MCSVRGPSYSRPTGSSSIWLNTVAASLRGDISDNRSNSCSSTKSAHTQNFDLELEEFDIVDDLI